MDLISNGTWLCYLPDFLSFIQLGFWSRQYFWPLSYLFKLTLNKLLILFIHSCYISYQLRYSREYFLLLMTTTESLWSPGVKGLLGSVCSTKFLSNYHKRGGESLTRLELVCTVFSLWGGYLLSFLCLTS